eukprot:3796899-Prymnesium_polylepis.1
MRSCAHRRKWRTRNRQKQPPTRPHSPQKRECAPTWAPTCAARAHRANSTRTSAAACALAAACAERASGATITVQRRAACTRADIIAQTRYLLRPSSMRSEP